MSAKTVVPADLSMDEARAAYIDAHRPIEPGSVRHLELIAYYENEADTDDGWAEMVESIKQSTDQKSMGWMYGNIFGVKPPFPKTEGPAWATSHEDDMPTPRDDGP